ncbi:GNAT family N-acetyltransferase [Rhodococcus sp. BP-252]|uniref:GNAT family N-acetyltransferase n=1 Tax=unclassified Rhodococcus (in: high G+C Gram-positive bacteria) TaxID=192944 RepID=UPI001C9AA945|nr:MULTISPECIES: GNAT family N-acetyltransferase [unclassified Rhodococcus (in: high G+C Gram-positive bacteria)]MBY6414765.1 GNAT family N-acetyltransferase [Rhodococcus sp. BP-320]MBY6419669.1 GNAT family N-acetyltransferase [Rhodococcus sp. BP-321]MBY6424646.1 GNAT family N-acetyltransferase [Rhodococcus sp. BP-324]MBY6429643.1 GNAT family N-acetyltransferase [Rhodococcus sp. BP-323]MBY6434635.1 GNAT family N-acetyltransferase [Rhodococcus sp. BP-322]
MATIRPGTASDASEIGEIFSEAFDGDPVWAPHLPDASTRRQALAEFYASEVEGTPEHVDVAVDEDGRLLGALIWEPPGPRDESGCFSPTEAGRAHDRAIEDQRPNEPHWYIHDIATSARARGTGVGTSLIQYRLDEIGSTTAFLESTTPASRRLYERFGFEAIITDGMVPGSSAMIRRA